MFKMFKEIKEQFTNLREHLFLFFNRQCRFFLKNEIEFLEMKSSIIEIKTL